MLLCYYACYINSQFCNTLFPWPRCGICCNCHNNSYCHNFPFSWVEDKIAADRVVYIGQNIKSLVKHWESKPKSKRPSSKSYENLKAAVNDPLTTAKLQFFSFVAGILQPFIKSYQTDQL